MISANESCDFNVRQRQQHRHRLHTECSRRTRTFAIAATAAFFCLTCPEATFAASRHMPEAGHVSGGWQQTSRFRFASPPKSNQRASPTTVAARASSPSKSSNSRLRFSGATNIEENETPPSSSTFNNTLTSTSAYGQTETEDETRVTTTSFFRLPSETLKQQEEQQSQELQPDLVSPQQHRPTTVQIQTRFVLSLMGIAGFVEGYCVRRHGCFPNLMTGTLLKVAESVSSWNLSAATIHASMVGCYIGGGWVFSRWKKTSAPSPNKNKPDRKESSLRAVSVLSAVFLLLSDVAENLPALKQARLPLLATAFGIINAGTMDVGAGVTYATTGHVTKVGQGLATGSIFQKTKDAYSKPPADRTSARGLIGFWMAALVANLVCGILEANTLSSAAAIAAVLEKIPLGLAVGLAYTSVFRWYVRAMAKASAAEAKLR